LLKFIVPENIYNMTRSEFNKRYLVEPIFTESQVLFYVYISQKVDYVTPAIDLQKVFELDQIDDNTIRLEIKEVADSLICEKYGIID
jgi:hypothetical protein